MRYSWYYKYDQKSWDNSILYESNCNQERHTWYYEKQTCVYYRALDKENKHNQRPIETYNLVFYIKETQKEKYD